MKYEYTAFYDPNNSNVPFRRRPVVEIELFREKKSIKIAVALVDSGADYCLFNIAYAKELGIDIDKCKLMHFTGIGGFKEGRSASMAKVDIKVKYLDHRATDVQVGFIDSDSVDALLGQEGFFDNFRIKFEKDHNTFEINPRKKK